MDKPLKKFMNEIRAIPSGEKELRSFGRVMGVAFGLLGALLFWKQRSAWPVMAGLSVCFFVSGLAFPRTLKVPQKAWMTLALVMGFVMTRVILSMVFYGVMTPIAFVLRVTGKRPLVTAVDRSAATYWTVRDNARKTRESYERQY